MKFVIILSVFLAINLVAGETTVDRINATADRIVELTERSLPRTSNEILNEILEITVEGAQQAVISRISNLDPDDVAGNIAIGNKFFWYT